MEDFNEKPKKKAPVLLRLLLIALTIYIFCFGFLVIFQRGFLYFPSGVYSTPQEAGVSGIFQEIIAKPEEGTPIKGWYAPAKENKPTIVFFHGNGDSIGNLVSIAQIYALQGYGFVITEYRGYSGFKGLPTEEGLYDDGRAFVKALQDKGVDLKDIVLFGHSLGSGVAVQLATELDVRAVMLLAPLLSVGDMAQALYPFFPAKYFVWDNFDNESKIVNINAPLLIVHGSWDRIIPVSQGESLYAVAQNPKTFILVPRGGHNNLFKNPFAEISMKWLSALK